MLIFLSDLLAEGAVPGEEIESKIGGTGVWSMRHSGCSLTDKVHTKYHKKKH